MGDLKLSLEYYVSLLPVGKSISYTEAERRAGEFLVAMAKVADLKHILTAQMIKSMSVQTAVFHTEMQKGTAKTVTENKLTAEASEVYTKAREDLEDLQNDISYLKAHYEIFNNSHIFYRNMAKGEVS
jgi:hypothetical protein